MARGNGLVNGVGVARSVSGAIAVDNATLSDANYPTSGGLNCTGFDTILVGAEIANGTAPTATIEALFRDDTDAPDGSRWKRVLVGARDGVTLAVSPASEDTGALAQNSDFVELKVFGHPLVFLRVKAVANSASTTSLKILVIPGKKR